MTDEELDDLLDAIAAGREEREREHRQPLEAMQLVRDSRLGALRVPREEGGEGVTIRGLFAVLVRLAEADPNVAHSLRSHFVVVEQRMLATDPGVRARWLERVVAGELFGNAVTELGGGHVPGGPVYATSVSRRSDGLIMNGEKFYSTGALHSDRVSVIACGEDGEVVNVIVPIDREGVRIVDDWDGIGQELTGSGTTRFVDVAVAPEELLRGPAQTVTDQLHTHEFSFAQLWLQAVIVGILRNVVTDAAAVVRGRERNFAHAPHPDPSADLFLQRVVGQLSASAFAAESTVLAAADALDAAAISARARGADTSAIEVAAIRSAQAKVHVDALAQGAASMVYDVGGASSVRRSAGLDRHWRNIRTLASHNPADYKAQAVGDLLINGRQLPTNGFF